MPLLRIRCQAFNLDSGDRSQELIGRVDDRQHRGILPLSGVQRGYQGHPVRQWVRFDHHAIDLDPIMSTGNQCQGGQPAQQCPCFTSDEDRYVHVLRGTQFGPGIDNQSATSNGNEVRAGQGAEGLFRETV